MKNIPGIIRSKIEELFGIDIRSLALFRIGLALLIIADLVNRASTLRAHYSDFGLLPRSALLEKFAYPWHLSIHLISGRVTIQGLLFLLAAVFALALLFGYRTRLATVVSWFFLISLHTRNPMILQGGDILFRLLLFWAMFLPLGATWSVDRALNSSEEKPPPRILSVGTFALLLQVALVYWFTAALKNPSSWWTEGSAVYQALSIDQFVTPLGKYFLNFPELLKTLTRATFLLEWAGPCLAFIPIFTAPLRTLTVFIFIFFHIGLGVSMELGLFPYFCIVGWFPFLPSGFWDWRPWARIKNLRWVEVLREKIGPAWANIYRRLPQRPLTWRNPWWVHALAVFFLGYILIWNVRTLNFEKYRAVFPVTLNWIGELLRIDQIWNMFSPYPLTDDGWYVIPGKLRNGQEVDVFAGGRPVSWEKPPWVSQTYRNQRWRKYMMNLWEKKNARHRLYYGRFLCRDWNIHHGGEEQMESFTIFFMREDTLPYPQPPRLRKVKLWEHNCFERPM